MAGKHSKPGFADRVRDEDRNKNFDISRAKHRAIGPWQQLTLFDMTPEEFTSVKGAGGRT